MDENKLQNDTYLVLYKLRQIRSKVRDTAIDKMIHRELLEGRPHVEKAIFNAKDSRFKIVQNLRERVNFFAIYNLFDWQARVNSDLDVLFDYVKDLEPKQKSEDDVWKQRMQSDM